MAQWRHPPIDSPAGRIGCHEPLACPSTGDTTASAEERLAAPSWGERWATHRQFLSPQHCTVRRVSTSRSSLRKKGVRPDECGGRPRLARRNSLSLAGRIAGGKQAGRRSARRGPEAHDFAQPQVHGGKTIRDLSFTNLYLGGAASWDVADIQHIDTALSA